ncbi:MAG: hypothetical protein ACOYMN_23800, partial [Roseimicrobium sp.]
GWMVLVVVGYVVGFANGLDQGKRDELRYRTIAAGAALRHSAPEPCFLDAVNPGMGPGYIPLLGRLEALGLLHVVTVRSERVQEATLDASDRFVGGFKNARVVDGKPTLSLWAVDRETRDAVDAVAISYEVPGQGEAWLGMAQKRTVNPKAAAKHRIHIVEDRVGWSYVYGEGTESGFMSDAPNPFQPKALPRGKVLFRAYAFEARTGRFTRLDGEAALELP